MQRQLDASLAEAMVEPSTLEAFLARIAHALATFCETPHCEVWIFGAGATDGLRLDRIAAHPPRVTGDECNGFVGNNEALLALSPTLESHHSVVADLRVLTLTLGMFGFVVLAREHHSINQRKMSTLRRVMPRVIDAVAQRLSHETLVQLNRRLHARNEVDRRLLRAFANVRTLMELAATIEHLAQELFAVEHSALFFLDPESAQLMRVSAHAVHPLSMSLDTAVANIDASPHEVLRTGRVIEFTAATEPTQLFADLSAEQCQRVRARLYIPVHVDGVVIGCIGFASAGATTNATTDATVDVPRDRAALSMLAEFAGLTYARVAVQHGHDRRGALIAAGRVASERLLGAFQWLPCANAALAIVGSAIDAGTLALIEVAPDEREPRAQFDDAVRGVALGDAHGDAHDDEQHDDLHDELDGAAHTKGRVECVWHPTFGLPWMHGSQLSRLTPQERVQLSGGESVTVALHDAAHPALLIPIVVDGVLWGVLAHESRVQAPRRLDAHELAALRTLADAFTNVIVRQRLHEAVHRRHKLEAAGVLAQRVAQEFNALLWPILTYTEMLEGMPSIDERARELLREMAQVGRRANDLVQKVLTISPRPERAFELVAVSTMVIEISAMVRRMVSPNVRVHDAIDTDSGVALGDVAAFREVLMTLARNAIDAVKQHSGVIRFQVERVERNASEWIRLFVRVEIDEARAAVADSSARHDGVATASVQRVIAHMGGTVHVQQHAHGGTSVELLLPVHGPAQTPVPTPVKMDVALTHAASMAAADATPARRILLVDDDASVLRVATEMLVACGYSVTACPSAARAIECLRDASLELSLLLTDFNMPVMDGIALARESKRLRRTLPVVCITGFGTAATERRAMEAGVNAFMRKPIDLENLALVLDEVIREAEQTTPTTAAKE